MSTHVELRLPMAEISDLAVEGAALDIGTSHAVAELGGHGRRPSLLGLRSWSVEVGVRLCADVLALALIYAGANPAGTPAALWAAVVLVSFAALGLYEHRLRLSALDDVPSIVVASAVGLMATYLVLGHLRHGLLPALLGGSVLILVLGRVVSYSVLRAARSQGLLRQEAVLVGGGPGAADLMSRIAQHPESGLHVRGVLGADGAWVPGASIYGDVAALPDCRFRRHRHRHRGGCVLRARAQSHRSAPQLCRRQDRRSTYCHGCQSSRISHDEVGGVPLQQLKQRRSRLRMAFKRGADVTIASAALFLVSPLIGLAALAVRLGCGPGVIYRQERVGLNGKRFQLLKLRSMRPLPPGLAPSGRPPPPRPGVPAPSSAATPSTSCPSW